MQNALRFQFKELPQWWCLFFWNKESATTKVKDFAVTWDSTTATAMAKHQANTRTGQCKSQGQTFWRTECWAQFPTSFKSKSTERTSHFSLRTWGKPSELKLRTLFYRTTPATVSGFANIYLCNGRKMFPFLTLAGNTTLCWAGSCIAQHCSVPGSSQSCPMQTCSELTQPVLSAQSPADPKLQLHLGLCSQRIISRAEYNMTLPASNKTLPSIFTGFVIYGSVLFYCDHNLFH